MKLGFYPGCSMQGSSPEYNESLTAITKMLGIPMEAISDWNCCGATAAHNLNKSLSHGLTCENNCAGRKTKSGRNTWFHALPVITGFVWYNMNCITNLVKSKK